MKMAEFVEIHRGGKALHFEDYAYSKIRDGEEGLVFWRCQLHKNRGCPGRATLEGASIVVRHQHNYPLYRI